MTSWKTLARRTVLDKGRFLRVEDHKVRLPDGRIIPDWPWVVTPDYANVVAVDPAGRFLCFRQTKYAVKGRTLSLVGGYLEPGEKPAAAARRELLEESGCRASDWSFLGRFRVDSNRGAGTAHLYLARGARPVAAIASDDLEAQQMLWLTRPQLDQALDRGAFRVLAWTTAIALALRRLDR
jgi:8-oxo-dGTP pyrophosphatase MutT (NUDIX family)